MTDKEMAKEYRKSLWQRLVDEYEFERLSMFDENVEEAWLAGLKTGKDMNVSIKWHDLVANPNDLPEDTYDVLDQAGYKVHYNFFQNVWVNEKDEIDEHVIAWCEIPQYTER